MRNLNLPIRTPAHRQRGVVLFIALIVLVAMTLAAIGMVRSIDTATAVAGNLGFKEASVSAGDQGIETAFQWLLKNAAGTTLNSDVKDAGYYSASPPSEDPDSWADPFTINAGKADAAGNTVSYWIHRMCIKPNLAYNEGNNECATQASEGTGVSHKIDENNVCTETDKCSTPRLFYRITAHVQGPHNTESYVQAIVSVSN